MAQPHLNETLRNLTEFYANSNRLTPEDFRNINENLFDQSQSPYIPYIVLMNATIADQHANEAAEQARTVAERGREMLNTILIRPPAELRPRPTPGVNHNRGRGRRSPLATLPKRQKNKVNYKTLAKAVLASPCADICAICMDTHNKGDSIITECGHEFGRECWNSWANSLSSNSSCPTCRKYCPSVTVFRARKPRTLTNEPSV